MYKATEWPNIKVDLYSRWNRVRVKTTEAEIS